MLLRTPRGIPGFLPVSMASLTVCAADFTAPETSATVDFGSDAGSGLSFVSGDGAGVSSLLVVLAHGQCDLGRLPLAIQCSEFLLVPMLVIALRLMCPPAGAI